MIVKTRAVVLREIKYRDQSKICLLLTREYGQLSVILKAVRNPKNRMSGLFSAGNIVDVVIYKRSTREIQLASDASLVLSPLSQEPDLDRFAALYRVLDLTRHASGPEEKNLQLYTLLASTIERLCEPGVSIQSSLAWFLLRLAGVLGFEPSIDRCVFSRQELLAAIHSRELDELHFVHDPGGFALPGAGAAFDCSLQPVPVERYLLLRAIAPDGGNASIPEADPSEFAALADLLQEYCSRHLERMPHRKHLDIVSRLISA
ncbi:MAG: DNA repair protein RecO [Chlorobiaceae bacterium]|nr:DNA repair protein RecO [Chlorobiaceae bacterium]